MVTKSKEPLKYQVGWLATLFATSTDYQSISLADDGVIFSGHKDGCNYSAYFVKAIDLSVISTSGRNHKY